MTTDHTENQENIAIISGRGSLPRELTEGLSKKGPPPFLVEMEGEAGDWILNYEHVSVEFGQVGKLFKALKEHSVTKVVFAGGVTRPKIQLSKLDWGGVLSLPQILAFMIGGDNSLLSGVIHVFEKRGIKVVGAHEILPELLSHEGKISGPSPSRKAKRNIQKAFRACQTLGALDIGQAAVAVGERVVAVEGIEGTDGMLKRVADMRNSGILYEDGKAGVLVKTMKPGQDKRADLPAIGPDTIRHVSDAGLMGVAIEAGNSMILEREETLKLAQDMGVFVFGCDLSKMDLGE